MDTHQQNNSNAGDHPSFENDKDDLAYQFNAADLTSPDADRRRCAIIAVSKLRLLDYEDRLISMVETELNNDNKRHLVRALGHIGGTKSISFLSSLMGRSSGLILGDLATALSDLAAPNIRELVEPLTFSEIPFITERSRCALRKLLRSKDQS